MNPKKKLAKWLFWLVHRNHKQWEDVSEQERQFYLGDVDTVIKMVKDIEIENKINKYSDDIEKRNTRF